MNKTLLRSIATIGALGLIAGACGGDDDDATPADSVVDEATGEATVEATGDGTGEATGDASDAPDLGGRTVTIAVENAYLPFNYLDPETGEPTGWDYEVIDAICELINCTPEYQTFSWEPMIQAVADGQFDMAADGITITDERAEIVDYSEGYISLEQRMLVAADSEFETVDDVLASDCRIASQIGTTNLATAQETFGEDRVDALDEFGFVVQSVIAGDHCAAIIDETAGQGYVGANADAVKLVGESLSSDELGFIFPKGSDLVEPFNHALDVLKQDGTLETVSAKYFGDSFTISYDDIEFPECGVEEGCTEEEATTGEEAATEEDDG